MMFLCLEQIRSLNGKVSSKRNQRYSQIETTIPFVAVKHMPMVDVLIHFQLKDQLHVQSKY